MIVKSFTRVASNKLLSVYVLVWGIFSLFNPELKLCVKNTTGLRDVWIFYMMWKMMLEILQISQNQVCSIGYFYSLKFWSPGVRKIVHGITVVNETSELRNLEKAPLSFWRCRSIQQYVLKVFVCTSGVLQYFSIFVIDQPFFQPIGPHINSLLLQWIHTVE